MMTLSVEVPVAGVVSVGLIVAVACRVGPAAAFTRTVTAIIMRRPAPIG